MMNDKNKIVAVLLMLILVPMAPLFIPQTTTLAEMPDGDTTFTTQGGGNITTTGLTFEDLEPHWTSEGVRLTNSYVNTTLTAKQVFVPDNISNLTEHFTYDMQEWHGDQARFWVTLTYLDYTHADYGSLHLNNLLGNLPQQEPISFDDAVNFTEWDGTNTVLYSVGDVVLYGGDYYLCKQQIYNYNGVPPNLPQYWEVTEESEGSVYPSNRFQISNKEVWATNKTDKGYVCDVDNFTDSNANFDVSWNISVRSHYNYIIFDYDLIFENETTTETVATFQDVYEDEQELLAVKYQLNKYNDSDYDYYVDRALMNYDNQYGENKTVNVTIAYPESKTLIEFYADGGSTEITSQYDVVEAKATTLGKTETLLDTTTGYTIRSFSVDVIADEENVMQYMIPSQKGEYNDLRMWVVGSFAGGSGTTLDPYEIENAYQLQEMENYTSSSFELISDIDASDTSSWNGGDGFDPIGDWGSPFTGVLDGNGHSITSLEITITGDNVCDWGLFGAIDSGARIRDVGLDATITSVWSDNNDRIGLLVGCMGGATTKISECYVSGTCSASTSNYHVYVGGMIGQLSGGTVENCYSTADVSGASDVGGMIGLMPPTGIYISVENCFSTGFVTGTSDTHAFIGDIGSPDEFDGNYYNNQTSGCSDSQATSRNTSDMTDYSASYPNCYSGWDFSDVWDATSWNVDGDGNTGYPALQWQDNPADNENPTIDTYSPTNQSILSALQPTVSITVDDEDVSDTLSVTFSTNESGSWSDNQTNSSMSPGDTAYWDFTAANSWNTKYWWRINVSDGSNTTSAIYWFETNSIPELQTPSVTPSSGNESDTQFNITIQLSDVDNDTQSVYCNVTLGAWYSNQSMTYLNGSNDTGANYTILSDYPTIGTLTATIHTYDGSSWNASPTITFDVLGNASFQINFPVFLQVGQYIFADGAITDADGEPVSSIWATTKILNSTYSVVSGTELDYYVMNGLYRYTFSTTTMTPGIYYININFTYGGNPFFSNRTLYLSDYSGSGHHATNAYFTFYNNNTGVGINPLSFKIYADNDLPLTDSDRTYDNLYPNTYTGETIYYRIDDYFDNKIYPTDDTYSSVTISETDQFIDVPIDWNSFSVKNMNSSIIKFTIENGSRSYSQYLYPYEPFYWNVLDGEYNITMDYYDPATDAYEGTTTDTISVTDDTYYWIQGYDLRDIIVEINAVNATVGNLSMNITSNVNITNSSIDSITTAITSNLTATETNITNLINSYSSNYSIIESYVANLDNNIWSNLTSINSTIDVVNNKINIDFQMLESNISSMNNSISSQITAINTTIDGQTNTIITTIHNQNSNISGMNNSLQFRIDVVESNISNMNTSIHSAVSVVDSVVDTINNKIDIDLSVLNATVNAINNNININFSMLQSNISHMNNTIHTEINLLGSNITNMNTSIHNAISNIDSIVNHMNSSIWNELTAINTTINTQTNTISTKINAQNSNISGMNNSLQFRIDVVESNISNMNTSIHSAVSVVDSVVDTINNKIDIDLSVLNATVNAINNNININFSMLQSNISHMNNTIHTEINLLGSNITNMNTSIHNAISNIDSIVNHMNSSIWNELTAINTTINTQTNTISTKINAQNSNISGMNNSILTELSVINSNITSMNNNIRSAVNITNSTVGYINNTIWGEINAIDVVLDDLNNTMQSEFTMLNSSMNNVSVNITGEVNINDTNITNMLANMWGNINVTNSNLSYLNTTIWGEFSITNSNINDTQITVSGIWNDQNQSFNNLENQSTVLFNFYNTNDGIGIDRESLKVYVNGSRLTNNVYYCSNETDLINVTIKDYYDMELFQQNFTVNSTYLFLDLGLTYHSWLFGNKNDNYYMISINRNGSSRWFERGILPGGEREFLLPTGNYTMRIYDAAYDEIHNQSYTMNNSKIYVIEGTNLTEILNGLSVVRGSILEVNNNLDYALTPDVETVCSNPPIVKAMHSADGRQIADGVFLICPALVVTAETRQSDTNSSIASVALVPSNSSVSNGTVTLLRDTLYFEGAASTSYVNITYTNNGTLLQNTSYIPNKLDLYGENVTINSSNDIKVTRETKYHQYKKFDWTWYSYESKYETGIEIINPQNASLYDIDVLIEFAENSSPDVDSVTVKDVSNDNVILEAGKNFKVTDTGIEFSLLSMNASSTRRFQCRYFSKMEEQYTFGIKHTTLETYNYAEDGGKYESTAQWIYNDDDDKVFNGVLYIDMNFEEAKDIKGSSVTVFDDNADRQLSRDAGDFMVMGSTIVISESGLGTVSPGASKHYTIQFLMTENDGEIADFNLKSILFMVGGFPITVWMIGLIVCLAVIAIAFFYIIYYNDRKPTWNEWGTFLKIAAIPTLIMFMLFVFMVKG